LIFYGTQKDEKKSLPVGQGSEEEMVEGENEVGSTNKGNKLTTK